MIVTKSNYEIQLMREAGKVVAECHAALKDFIKPGITTLQIDEFVEKFITRHKMIPAQKGYNGYPFAACTSVNDVICHGFPSDYVLKMETSSPWTWLRCTRGCTPTPPGATPSAILAKKRRPARRDPYSLVQRH